MTFPFSPFLATLLSSVEMIFAGFMVAVKRRDWTDPLILLIWRRMARVELRFKRLMALLAAGKVPAEPKARAPRAAAEDKPAVEKPKRVVMPSGHLWLVRMFPGDAAAFAERMQILVSDPRTQQVLAAVPKAIKILQPVCRILGVALGTVRAAVQRLSGRSRDLAGRFAKPTPRARPAGKHWIEPYPGTDIRFLIE